MVHNSIMKNIKNILWGIPIGLINGFFASGGGVAAVYILEKFLHLEAKKAHATAIGIILPLSCASLFVYGSSAQVQLKTIMLCALGGCAGGLVGARLLNRMPKRWLKTAFGAVMIVAGVRMIW